MQEDFIHSVLVIGDGPSAVTFINRLNTHGISCTLVSPSMVIDELGIEGRLQKISPDIGKGWKFSNTTKHTIRTELFHVGGVPDSTFNHVGYKGVGGLTNRWGAGCAKLTSNDLGIDSSTHAHIEKYYQEAEKEVGIYFHGPDKLNGYAGDFIPASRRLNQPTSLKFPVTFFGGVSLGRARQAILSEAKEGRSACNNCGGCFIYCKNKSLYNARDSLGAKNKFIENSLVTEIASDKGSYLAKIESNGDSHILRARIIILAAGTLESFKLLASFYPNNASSQLHHCNVTRSVFVSLKSEKKNSFPSGQFLAHIPIDGCTSAYASLTHGISIPTSDIVALSPYKNNLSYWFFNHLKKYIVVAMIFFPSKYSNYVISFNDSTLKFDLQKDPKINFNSDQKIAFNKLKRLLFRNRIFGFSFLNSILPSGMDIHYGGTIPMGSSSNFGCNEVCEVNGLKNIFVIDGSWMPKMSEKSHTFTLIANAMRVADIVAKRVKDD